MNRPSSHQNCKNKPLAPISSRVGNGSWMLKPMKISVKRGIMKNMKNATIKMPTQITITG